MAKSVGVYIRLGNGAEIWVGDIPREDLTDTGMAAFFRAVADEIERQAREKPLP